MPHAMWFTAPLEVKVVGPPLMQLEALSALFSVLVASPVALLLM